MMYIVMEIQTFENGTVSAVPVQYSDTKDAESAFHTILAAAAISELPVHAAVMMTNSGNVIKSEFYRHTEDEEG